MYLTVSYNNRHSTSYSTQNVNGQACLVGECCNFYAVIHTGDRYMLSVAGSDLGEKHNMLRFRGLTVTRIESRTWVCIHSGEGPSPM